MNPSRFNAKARLFAAHMDSRKAKATIVPCHYCGAPLSPETRTKEHLMPKSSGGKDVNKNVVFACQPCNVMRAGHDYSAFKAYMLPIKQARLKGLPIPDLDPFVPPSRKAARMGPESTMARVNRLARMGYTKELLRGCLTAHSMHEAGHSWTTIAEHFAIPVAAAKAFATVGSVKPEKRLETAERLCIVELSRG